MHQLHQELNQVTTSNNQTSYHRSGVPAAYVQGPFYGGLTTHSMMNHSPAVTSDNSGAAHGPILNALTGNSPPRPPPPPYPAQYNEIDPSIAPKPEVDSPSWPPQRPNTLALGNSSKKKILSNR